MKLSVIIVNYNVKHFLEQCLHSVYDASNGLDVETFVVDNNSVDGSNEMVREKFPNVHLIANKDNVGFSVANNQAMKIAKGEYMLLLNPDTIVEHDTFHKVVQFMDEHPDAGGLGCKMVDGKGHFLPESKRGLPTPDVAFYKIFGLSKVFPKSKTFSKYHLGYLDNDETHEVEILAGAFMLMRKTVLDKVGLLDETFFMYGEDIDLSYRIIKGGYKNYYYPEARIIHYKGESTKKGSVNYVFVFYNAMIIFAKKHFSQKHAKTFSFLINMAIYFRASLAILQRFMKQLFMPFLDGALLYGGIYLIKEYWEMYFFQSGGDAYYPQEFMNIVVPVYVLTWLGSMYLSGGYDKPIRLNKALQGVGIGTVLILVVYALLPESIRFSRALILMGTLWGMLSTIGLRFILHLTGKSDFRIGTEGSKRFVIVGDQEEVYRVNSVLRKTILNPGYIGFVGMDEKDLSDHEFVGTFDQLKEIIQIYKINEIIFCAKSIPAQKIINEMGNLQELVVDYKIAPPESLSIIGSNSINTSGDMYTVDINSIGKANNKRNKRFFDFIISILFLGLYPVLLFFVKKPLGFLRNILFVLFGKKSWTGYFFSGTGNTKHLPKIKSGVLTPRDVLGKREVQPETIDRLNALYARDYKIGSEINMIIKGFRNLGR